MAESARRLFTTDETAHRINVGQTKMFELIRTGEIESVKIGRARRIPAEAVEAYIQRLRAVSGGDAA